MTRTAGARAKSLAILLPPSEGKAPGGSRPAFRIASGRFGAQLSRPRTQVVRALESLGGGSAALLGVTGASLERARAANSSLVGSATLPAWQRYTGVVWDHIDAATLSPSAFARARESIVVISGLLGLVGFDDPIPDYKLKIGAALDLPLASKEIARRKLAAFWQPHVSSILDAWLADRTVIDLLPLEHRRVWEPSSNVEILRASFVDRRGRTVGHDAKAAKGLFVRHLLGARSPVRAIETWSHPEYRIEISAGS